MTVETYKGDAYCVKCKEKRDFEGPVKVSESGRRMAQGICPVCGTKVNRILGKAQSLNFIVLNPALAGQYMSSVTKEPHSKWMWGSFALSAG